MLFFNYLYLLIIKYPIKKYTIYHKSTSPLLNIEIKEAKVMENDIIKNFGE
jgi:hypothetical protein